MAKTRESLEEVGDSFCFMHLILISKMLPFGFFDFITQMATAYFAFTNTALFFFSIFIQGSVNLIQDA